MLKEESKLSPFDIVKNILESTDKLSEEDINSFYNSWVINHALSNIKDTVFFAEHINRFPFLQKDMQYAFLFYGINKRKRFGKWNKHKDDVETINLIMKKYPHYSYSKAKSIIDLVDKKELKKEFFEGGRVGKH